MSGYPASYAQPQQQPNNVVFQAQPVVYVDQNGNQVAGAYPPAQFYPANASPHTGTPLYQGQGQGGYYTGGPGGQPTQVIIVQQVRPADNQYYNGRRRDDGAAEALGCLACAAICCCCCMPGPEFEG